MQQKVAQARTQAGRRKGAKTHTPAQRLRADMQAGMLWIGPRE